MELTSTAFDAESAIPRKYSREGDDISPPLKWTGAPDEAKGFALICEDPDAPREEPWVHWVVANIPADETELAEGKCDGIEGRNDFDETGYGGPMPPEGHGTHHYHFVLYALDQPLDVESGMSKGDLERAMSDHVLEKAELVGTYER